MTWDSPEQMNGVFRGYKVYFNDQYVLTNYTNLTMSGLDGQTIYKFYVKALTIEDSKPSNFVSLETLTGGKNLNRTNM